MSKKKTATLAERVAEMETVELPYNHPLAQVARDAYNKARYGQCDVALIVEKDEWRHLVCLALIQWAENYGGVYENSPGVFSTAGGHAVHVLKSLRKPGVFDVIVVE